MKRLCLIVFSVAVSLAACDEGAPAKKDEPASAVTKGEPAKKDGTTAVAPKDDQHAAAGVTPGSHEDWCQEHAVAESQCTRCDPALIPAFKATNDWCEEHGLPESQCLKCNPDLKIVRPPKAE